MSIEFTLLISAIGICLTIVSTQRSIKKDEQANGEKDGTVMERLDNLVQMVEKLDKKFDAQNKEQIALRERIAKLETANKLMKPMVERVYNRVFDDIRGGQ